MDVTVVTPTIPERAPQLAELRASIEAQTVRPAAWVCGLDVQRVGPGPIVNDLIAEADTEWVIRVDDDDLLDPNFFETLAPHLTADADIVYPWCRVENGPIPDWAFQVPFDAEWLMFENFIPCTAAIRRDVFIDLGGYREPPDTPHEDWDLWRRALQSGARFLCVPTVTWTYRFGDWDHRVYAA